MVAPSSSASATSHEQGGGGAASSWRHTSTTASSFPLSLGITTTTDHIMGKVEESDDELFMVPDVEAGPAQTTDSNINTELHQANNGKRRRGRNPVDREHRRLKRLLRNRVSAQQARERKKVYVSDLESRATEMQDRNSKLEEKISTLVNENAMLRKVLMNTRPKVDESMESSHSLVPKI